LILRWGFIVNATPQVVAKLERRFHKYHMQILVFSKLTMGFGLAVPILMTAGMLRVSFARYCAINITGSFIWVAFVIYVGYNFGNVLQLVPEQFQVVSFFVLIAAFFVGLRYLNGKLAKLDW
jgi:membrane protein DedA with SNARE-associated domain